MFNKKYEAFLFAFINGLFMSGFMSFIITIINLGFIENFLTIWLNAYWKAFIIAFLIMLFVTPRIRKTIHLLIKE